MEFSCQAFICIFCVQKTDKQIALSGLNHTLFITSFITGLALYLHMEFVLTNSRNNTKYKNERSRSRMQGGGGLGAERTRPLNVPSHYNKGYFCLTEQFILNMSHWISSIIKHCCLLYSKGRLPAPIPPSEILLLPSNNLFFFIPK